MNTGWWVADVLHGAGPFMLLSWIFWVIFSITLHELGHGWAAIRVGDDTPVRTGHMSMNPLVHMGATSLIVFAVVGIAWGAMPVNPSRFRGKHADALVAAAGPAINVGLFVICIVGATTLQKYAVADAYAADLADGASALVERSGELTPEEFEAELERMTADIQAEHAARASAPPSFAMQAERFFSIGAMLNAVLFILNMPPVPPLDGSRNLASFSRGYRRLIEGPNAAMISLVGILFVFLVADDFIFGASGVAVAVATDLVWSILPG